MNSIQAHFANHLGKKICCNFGEEQQKELILKSVELTHVTALNGNPNEPITVAYEECRLIFNSTKELSEVKAPEELSLIRVESNLIPATKMVRKSWETVKKELETIGCNCSKISIDEFNANIKKRKKEYLWPRQVVLSVLHKLENLSAAKAGDLYDKDHATTLSSVKAIRSLTETDRIWINQYRDMLDYIIDFYKEKANLIIDVEKIKSV